MPDRSKFEELWKRMLPVYQALGPLKNQAVTVCCLLYTSAAGCLPEREEFFLCPGVFGIYRFTFLEKRVK